MGSDEIGVLRIREGCPPFFFSLRVVKRKQNLWWNFFEKVGPIPLEKFLDKCLICMHVAI
jgi:hypothetical protein